ncbi:putative Membrane protein [Pseudomonas syringae pv. antirrhini]|uniref:Putative Membrane protein n=2 Tax=Pseudomonas TaxID=286 RepID=A0A0P9P8M6_9PSED|nr:putative Membrane protein [Pseudomonas syringae pv. antirrhini]RMP36186.1 putative Membrane protein [Pseudomonas syringae pv. antirrhini]RMP41555.1 putative Membrane protein [Pseudomonas syringae pv. antirrhini]RMW31053.1 putative Membrane protein [Pseudomonas syringae pv. antirrhini]
MMAHAGARFTQGSVAQHIVVTASTSALSLFAIFLVDILTLVYVSMLHDPVLLAAVGIAKVLLFFNSALTTGLIIAAAAVLSERIGHRAARSVPRLTASLMLMVVMVSGLGAALQLALVVPITHWLGAEAATYDAARSFIWLTLPFTVLQAVMQMSAQMLRTTGDNRRALAVVLSAAATLAIADPLFIFVLDLGLKGAGIAFAVSAGVSASIGVYWVRRRIGLVFTRNLKLLRLHAGRTFRLALPAMAANLATPVGLAYLVASLSTFGTSALAAMTVLDRVLQFSYCAFFALPGALAPVLGQNIGANRDDRVRSAIVFSRRMVVFYGLAVWLVLILCGGMIADLYQLGAEARAVFIAFCWWGGGLWVVIGLDFVAIAVFITMKKSWWVAVFAWLRATAGTVPFVLAGTHWFGSSGALPGMFAGNAVIALISIATASLTAKRFFTGRAGGMNAQAH